MSPISVDHTAAFVTHNVAHVLNAWTRMPDLRTQANLDGVFTADFTAVRALLSRGRTYEKAVEQPTRRGDHGRIQPEEPSGFLQRKRHGLLPPRTAEERRDAGCRIGQPRYAQDGMQVMRQVRPDFVLHAPRQLAQAFEQSLILLEHHRSGHA
jgi:hypothetical protein